MRNQDRINMARKVVVDGATTYIASAPTGASQAAAVWQCKKIVVTGGTTVLTWANGSDLFNSVATDLSALTYS